MNKEEIIKKFKMEIHPEGGYFVETYKSEINYSSTKQTLYSSILFLLGNNDISHLHILEEDELWYFQGGDSCTIIDIDSEYNVRFIKLGIGNNEIPQYLVKKGHIFGSKYIGKTFTLVGCMVSPSFTYDHFKLIKKDELIDKLDKKVFERIQDMFID